MPVMDFPACTEQTYHGNLTCQGFLGIISVIKDIQRSESYSNITYVTTAVTHMTKVGYCGRVSTRCSQFLPAYIQAGTHFFYARHNQQL